MMTGDYFFMAKGRIFRVLEVYADSYKVECVTDGLIDYITDHDVIHYVDEEVFK